MRRFVTPDQARPGARRCARRAVKGPSQSFSVSAVVTTLRHRNSAAAAQPRHSHGTATAKGTESSRLPGGGGDARTCTNVNTCTHVRVHSHRALAAWAVQGWSSPWRSVPRTPMGRGVVAKASSPPARRRRGRRTRVEQHGPQGQGTPGSGSGSKQAKATASTRRGVLTDGPQSRGHCPAPPCPAWGSGGTI